MNPRTTRARQAHATGAVAAAMAAEIIAGERPGNAAAQKAATRAHMGALRTIEALATSGPGKKGTLRVWGKTRAAKGGLSTVRFATMEWRNLFTGEPSKL